MDNFQEAPATSRRFHPVFTHRFGGRGTFLIVGHTDNVGDFGTNQTLSRDRAAVVTEALASGHDEPRSAMVFVGADMAAPAASNSNETARAKNRRLEIVAM